MHQFLSKEEYLRLINEAHNDSVYKDEDDPNNDLNSLDEIDEDLTDLKRRLNAEVIDASKLSKKDIKKNIFKCNNFKVGKFVVKVMKYYENVDNDNSKLDISLWEQAGKMIYRLNPASSEVFKQCSSLKYFNDKSAGKTHIAKEIPAIEVVYFIKYLQAISNLSSFT